jgi:hypothetical protein
MSYKAAFFTKTLLLGATCAPLLLTACNSDHGPYPMPSGYMHHSEVYKAPDGPELMVVETEAPGHEMPVPAVAQEEPMVQAAVVPVVAPAMLETEDWQAAADSLIKDLTTNFGKPQLPVYIMPGKSVEEMSLADALANALLAHEIDVSTERGLSPFALSYMIVEPMEVSDSRKMVKIILSDYDKKIAEESGLFHIGPYSETAPKTVSTPSMSPKSSATFKPTPAPMPDQSMNRSAADSPTSLSRPTSTAMSRRNSTSYNKGETKYEDRVVSMPVMDDETSENR